MRRETATDILTRLGTQLSEHQSRIVSDPQANPVKLLAYDISKDVEERRIAFRDIESIVKIMSDEGAIARAKRLRARSGAAELDTLEKQIKSLATKKSKDGFKAFKMWAENPGQGIVLTAHPTFSLSRDIRETLGKIASNDTDDISSETDHLKTLPYLPKRAPTLQEEHFDAQAAIARIQGAIDRINQTVLDVAAKAFPEKWTQLTPYLMSVYSWVGYDIDGRTDITWGDALRLRLEEKSSQLGRYLGNAVNISDVHNFDDKGETAIKTLIAKLENAHLSAARDLELFNKDLSNTDNLVAAANHMTRASDRRFLNLKPALPLIKKAIAGAKTNKGKRDLLKLRAKMSAFGLGTSRIHFRLNNRHVVSAVRAEFGIRDSATDNRTVLMRASKLTKNVKAQKVNFASLALEKSTAHQQMILTAQIHKYIDDETPIRLLIAECEDSLTPLGMLYIARLYGLENHLDISPLFETADALNNGGRIISKMLSNSVYREYIENRGTFAIQTGFSDAGRFMGQIPATLAIERLQSHFAAALEKHKVKKVTAIVFNTHGEGNGRGGHPGTIKDRVDYVMSPWAVHQFEKRKLALCHETSFQGGDGYMWFQTKDLAFASTASLLLARNIDRSDAEEDDFYKERDFSWDVYRTMSSEQDSLYNDNNYVSLLGGFGQNLLIPTGSRAAKRAAADQKTGMFNPRQLRAIPHNAILQQYGAPANIFYGVGRAAEIDIEKFVAQFHESARAYSIFTLVTESLRRTNLSILTAYGRLFDPGFWISRALSGNEPLLSNQCLMVADTLKASPWRSQLMDLANRLRMDTFDSIKAFKACDESIVSLERDRLTVLHALRLAVIMKMMIVATELPAHGDENTSRLNVLQRLQNFQIDSVIADLERRYPERTDALAWTDKLTVKTKDTVAGPGGYPHIAQTIIKPMIRGSELVRQITIAITHHSDAFG